MDVTDSRIGGSLREARERKGKTLAEIAQVTHIRPDHLEAIEREDFTSLPQIYVRLHIRTYAEEVGLDPTPLLAHYEKRCPAADQIPVAAPRYQPLDTGSATRGAWIRWVAATAVVVVAAVAVVALIGHLSSRSSAPPEALAPPSSQSVDTLDVGLLSQPPDSLAAATGVTGPAALPPATPDSLSPAAENVTSEVPEAALDSSLAPGASGDDEQSYTPSLPDSGAGAPEVGYPSPSPPGGIVVSVSARNRVWMQVYTAEDILYYGILQPGEQRTWRDPVGIELKVRNWRDVALTVAGQPVAGVPPDAEEVKLCITASGIDVLQGREWRLHRGPFEPPTSGAGEER